MRTGSRSTLTSVGAALGMIGENVAAPYGSTNFPVARQCASREWRLARSASSPAMDGRQGWARATCR